MIAERTRAALAVRKAQGVALGNRTNLATAQAHGTARVLEKQPASRRMSRGRRVTSRPPPAAGGSPARA